MSVHKLKLKVGKLGFWLRIHSVDCGCRSRLVLLSCMVFFFSYYLLPEKYNFGLNFSIQSFTLSKYLFLLDPVNI